MYRAAFFLIAGLLFSGLRSQNMTTGEYWLDSDPGFGLATPVTFPNNSDVSGQVEIVDLDGLSPGQHVLGIRSKDENGTWGLTNCKNLLVEQGDPGNIALLEYYWDTDPGFGNGTAVTMGQGNDVPAYALMAEVVPTPGQHFLYTRTLDERHAWSHTIRDTVQVVPVGIDELKGLGFHIHPNPFAERLFVEPSDGQAYFLDIRDGNGRVVHQQRIQGYTTISLNAIASGTYHLLIHLPSGDIYSSKIAKR